MIFLALQSFLYLSYSRVARKHAHTHVAVSQREGFEGPDCGAALGFLSPCHCCGSGHRQMANCHSNWEKRTQEDERVREWGERGRRIRRTDRSYQGLPCFSKEQQLRHTRRCQKSLYGSFATLWIIIFVRVCVMSWVFHGAILFWSILIASFMVTVLRIEWTEQQQRDRNRRREGVENRKKRRSKSKGSEGFREIYIWWIFERFKAPRPNFSLLTETKANHKHQGEEKGKWEKESERDFYT